MKLWIDAQLSPAIASWISDNFAGVEAAAIRDLGLRDAIDSAIFFAARAASANVMTKDGDFAELQRQHGAPPKIIWVTCGNTSNKRLRAILSAELKNVVELLDAGEDLVEIAGH